MIHTPASVTTALPQAIVDYLDGSKLNERVGEAISVTTIDADGCPHGSLLSVGEILAIDAQHLKIAVWAESTTARNLARDGRISLTLALDGGLWEVLLDAKPASGEALAMFTATVRKVRTHKVEYADVLTSVTYRLHDQAGVMARWERQIADLRDA
ncbi:pyridoxamine 5'-phosphate oxidase family protein [Sphingomonas sp. 10B4]|nr:pyridoxamine 5'-phosphate oxidase family protein [Sphingomonas sp. 10B4]